MADAQAEIEAAAAVEDECSQGSPRGSDEKNNKLIRKRRHQFGALYLLSAYCVIFSELFINGKYKRGDELIGLHSCTRKNASCNY